MADPAQLVSRRVEFHQALHRWYRVHHRKLPWRDAPSLYKTVVSEFMLQQTQVATMLPYFERWQRDLPDFAALAAAPGEKVMQLWEGLGYYSRARNLHQLARTLARLPAPPRALADWRELPGVGPYTAAAVTSISFGEPAACVDGNVVRILARLANERRIFRDGSEATKHFAPLADALISDRDPGMHNQAMMELGATICLRQNPRCHACPVAAFCAGRKAGEPEKLPRLQPKRIEPLTIIRAWCVRRGQLLLKRGHPKARRLAGLHELPEFADLGLPPPKEDSLVAIRRRAITRYRITESIHRVPVDAGLTTKIRADTTLEWIPLEKLDSVTLSGPHRRWIGEILSR